MRDLSQSEPLAVPKRYVYGRTTNFHQTIALPDAKARGPLVLAQPHPCTIDDIGPLAKLFQAETLPILRRLGRHGRPGELERRRTLTTASLENDRVGRANNALSWPRDMGSVWSFSMGLCK